MIDILRKVRDFIRKYNLTEKGDKIVVGLSGGADSVFLLHTLYMLKDDLEIDISAAHINHCLRGHEAERDAKFAKEFAKSLAVPFYLNKTDVKSLAAELKISEEEAGRKVRYDFFDSICQKWGGGKIATAHNMNDNAETVLMHLIRGSGMAGLCGIPPKRDNIIRPVLGITRAEIEEYCRENKLLYVTDSTNSETIYTRNKVRLELIPKLTEINPGIITGINNLSSILTADNEFIEDCAKKTYNEVVKDGKIDINKLKTMPQSIMRRQLIMWAKEKGISLENVHIEKLSEFLGTSVTGKKIDVNGATLAVSYGFLTVSEKNVKKEFCHILKDDCDLTVCGYRIKSDMSGKFSFNKGDTIEIRNRRDGDKIRVNGVTKKIKKLFIDKKIPAETRSDYPVITANGEPVCVLGLVTGDYFKENKAKDFVLKIFKEVHNNE